MADKRDKSAEEKNILRNFRIERNTSIIAAIVLGAILSFIMLGILIQNLALSVASAGAIAFFGILIISGYNKKSSAKPASQTKGIMRRAIAGSLIIVYIIAFSMITFSDSDDHDYNEKVLTHFTNVVMVIIVFYFGSKAVLQYLEFKKEQENGNQPPKSGTEVHPPKGETD